MLYNKNKTRRFFGCLLSKSVSETGIDVQNNQKKYVFADKTVNLIAAEGVQAKFEKYTAQISEYKTCLIYYNYAVNDIIVNKYCPRG